MTAITQIKIAVLAPYGRYIIASPDNLHLSYYDLCPFEQLDVGLPVGDMSASAKMFAQHAFGRLTEDIQTAVTVAVYDVDRVQGILALRRQCLRSGLDHVEGTNTGIH